MQERKFNKMKNYIFKPQNTEPQPYKVAWHSDFEMLAFEIL